MTIGIAKVIRTSSGIWTSRKMIPADVREALGKRKEKPTWPASRTATQRRAMMDEWADYVKM